MPIRVQTLAVIAGGSALLTFCLYVFWTPPLLFGLLPALGLLALTLRAWPQLVHDDTRDWLGLLDVPPSIPEHTPVSYPKAWPARSRPVHRRAVEPAVPTASELLEDSTPVSPEVLLPDAVPSQDVYSEAGLEQPTSDAVDEERDTQSGTHPTSAGRPSPAAQSTVSSHSSELLLAGADPEPSPGLEVIVSDLRRSIIWNQSETTLKSLGLSPQRQTLINSKLIRPFESYLLAHRRARGGASVQFTDVRCETQSTRQVKRIRGSFTIYWSPSLPNGQNTEAGSFELELKSRPVDLIALDTARFSFSTPTFDNLIPFLEVDGSESFRMSRTPISVDQWEFVMGRQEWADRTISTGDVYDDDDLTTPTRRIGSIRPKELRGAYPITHVSWFDAVEFCSTLSRLTGPAKLVMLPTSVQWEHACWGDDPQYGSDQQRVAWFGGDVPKPVGKKAPNSRGLYDMLGNVWEWCADISAAKYRVLHGGCFYDYPTKLNRPARSSELPNFRSRAIGFRCIMSLPPNTEWLSLADLETSE